MLSITNPTTLPSARIIELYDSACIMNDEDGQLKTTADENGSNSIESVGSSNTVNDAFSSSSTLHLEDIDRSHVISGQTTRRCVKKDASTRPRQTSDVSVPDSTCERNSLRKRKCSPGGDHDSQDKKRSSRYRRHARSKEPPSPAESPNHAPQFNLEAETSSFLAMLGTIREDNEEFNALSDREKLLRVCNVLQHTMGLFRRVVRDARDCPRARRLVDIISNSELMTGICDQAEDIEAYEEHMRQPGATWDTWAVGDDELSKRRRANTEGYVLPWNLKGAASPK
ncbi:hypothetical protein BDN70DRAFT_655140 [Pholiota conissans]|uniref:Uncharacterized protein n=1 Tax=Pholiota conissans TaxID=109636 RepID=A0A9P5Z4V6_9AGAR|nr:hypothetical protein BDN70DRAFT_655140 [Pholiota conissans]